MLPRGEEVMSKEKSAASLPGIPVLLVLVAAIVFAFARIVRGAQSDDVGRVIEGALGTVAAVLLLVGLFMVEPNQARVLTLFGAYRGTERRAGLRWANPFYGKRAI